MHDDEPFSLRFVQCIQRFRFVRLIAFQITAANGEWHFIFFNAGGMLRRSTEEDDCTNEQRHSDHCCAHTYSDLRASTEWFVCRWPPTRINSCWD